MKRKRFVKRLMALGASRNDAGALADACDGNVSHNDVLASILAAWADTVRGEWARAILPDETNVMLRSAIMSTAIDSAAFGRVTGGISGSLGSRRYG